MYKISLIEENTTGRYILSVINKRTLSIIVYYTLAVLALCSCAFFIYCLSVRGLVMWARIVYFIWAGLVAAAVIYDIICTGAKHNKETTGLMIYVLSVLAVIMAIILYFLNSGVNGLAENFFNMFLSVSIVSLMTTGFMIATWCVGEAVCEHRSAEIKIDERR